MNYQTKTVLHNLLSILSKALLGLLSLIILYLLSALLLSYIPVNSDFYQCQQNPVSIYLMTNGVHTDIVVPIKNDMQDWTTFVNPSDTKSGDTGFNYVAFGWGDKNFYLNTPTWSDLKFATAFKALFCMDSAAMHVSFYNNMYTDKSCRKIPISQHEYKKLCSYIQFYFEKQNKTTLLIKGASYEDNDLFYDAKGSYNMFFTCNTWVNDALKTAGLKACLWTPFDIGFFHLYRK